MAKRRPFTGASVFRYLRKQAEYLGVPEDVVNSYKTIEVVVRAGTWNSRMDVYSRIRNEVKGILKQAGIPNYDFGKYLAFVQEYFSAMEKGWNSGMRESIVRKYSEGCDATILGQIRSMIERVFAPAG